MNQQPGQLYSSLNPWFLYPFYAWVFLGGISLIFFNSEILFAIVNTHHSPFLDTAMVYITKMGEGVFGAIILLLLVAKRPFRNWWYFSAALLCNLIPSLFTQLVKSWVHAPRPLKYFNDAPWIHYNNEWERLLERSFPSGHTTAAFCLFCFLACVLGAHRRWFGVLFFVLALLVGYSRIYLAAHFFLDVYVGSIIGVVFTILVVLLMRKYAHLFYRAEKPESSSR
jgi:membrane-associated phospholipid phosphatase